MGSILFFVLAVWERCKLVFSFPFGMEISWLRGKGPQPAFSRNRIFEIALWTHFY